MVERARRKVGGCGGLLEKLGDGLIDLADVFLLPEPVEKPHQHPCIAERSMAIGCLQMMPADQRVEPMRIVLGKEGPRQPDCAQDVGAESVAAAAKLGLDEAVVEASVVGDKNSTCEQPGDGRQELREARCVAHHVVGDAGERLDVGRNRNARVDER